MRTKAGNSKKKREKKHPPDSNRYEKTSLAVQSARLVWSLIIYNLNMYHEKLKTVALQKSGAAVFFMVVTCFTLV